MRAAETTTAGELAGERAAGAARSSFELEHAARLDSERLNKPCDFGAQQALTTGTVIRWSISMPVDIQNMDMARARAAGSDLGIVC